MKYKMDGKDVYVKKGRKWELLKHFNSKYKALDYLIKLHSKEK